MNDLPADAFEQRFASEKGHDVRERVAAVDDHAPVSAAVCLAVLVRGESGGYITQNSNSSVSENVDCFR